MTSRLALRDDPETARVVHAALTHLTESARSARRPLPPIVAMAVGAGTVEVTLASPLGRAPSPWRAEAHVWRVDTDVVEAVAHPDGQGWEAWPALVPVGLLDDGRWWLVDLAAAPGVIGLAGSAEAVDVWLRHLAGQLLEAPWARVVRVSLLGVEQVGDPRLRVLKALGEVVGDAPVPPGGVNGRWGGVPRHEHDVVIATRTLTPDEGQAVRSASVLRSAPTVIAPVADADACAWLWQVGEEALTW